MRTQYDRHLVVADLALVVAGLVLLVYAVDHFVVGAARLASALSVPKVLIGAVVMGFGTSAPELLVSTIAARGGDLDLGVGNVVGSNVANLSLVLAVAALLTRITISPSLLKGTVLLSVLAAAAFTLVVVDGQMERWEGALLAVGLVAAVTYLLRSGAGGSTEIDLEAAGTPGRDTARLVFGLVGTVAGAHLLVVGATGLAEFWGLTGGFIGFSLVALGTSLPELVTTFAAARRKEAELIVGNLFGSNVFNSLAVGGSMGLVGPGLIGDATLTGVGLVVMMVAAVVPVVLARRRWLLRRVRGGDQADPLEGALPGSLQRVDGLLLLSLYVVAMIVLGVGSSA